jgi:hypothetical protein
MGFYALQGKCFADRGETRTDIWMEVRMAHPFALAIKRLICRSTNDLIGRDDALAMMGPVRLLFDLNLPAQGSGP